MFVPSQEHLGEKVCLSFKKNFFVRLKNVDVFYFDDITQMRWVPILCRRKIIFLLFYPLNLRTHKQFQMWHKLISAILHQLYLLLLLLSYSEFISAHFFSHLFVSLCKNMLAGGNFNISTKIEEQNCFYFLRKI